LITTHNLAVSSHAVRAHVAGPKILEDAGAPQVPPFKVTQGHWNRRGLISYY